jgi:hypothetical protein
VQPDGACRLSTRPISSPAPTCHQRRPRKERNVGSAQRQTRSSQHWPPMRPTGGPAARARCSRLSWNSSRPAPGPRSRGKLPDAFSGSKEREPARGSTACRRWPHFQTGTRPSEAAQVLAGRGDVSGGGFGDRAPPRGVSRRAWKATHVAMGQVPPFRTWQRWIRRRIEFAVRWAVRTSSAKTGATALPTMSDALAAVRRERGRLGLVALARVQPPVPPPAAPKSPPRRPVGALRRAAETIVRTQGPIDAASIAIMLDVRPPQIVGAFATSKVVRHDGGRYTLA